MSSPIGSEERRPRHSQPEQSPEETPVYDATQSRDTDARNSGSSARDTDTSTRAMSTPVPRSERENSADREYTAERDYTPDTGSNDTRQHSDPFLASRETAIAREKEAFGGVKVGSAFFGWLAATGMAVLLTALVAAAGTAVGLATNPDVNSALGQAAANETVGLVGIIVLLVILFVSYYSGGYVAGRMARFNGAKQGMMVWIWALIAAVIIAVLGMIAGEQFNILAQLNSFPRIPVNEGQLTTTSIIAAVVVAAVALVGAVVGGMAGMRFHRKVDRAGFTPTADYEEH
ncbi:MAG: TIGR04086 family membrane protein [Actinomycetota bacterium]|nr:TIGR04086 family membrane protein [Actinomycetota bacterium]